MTAADVRGPALPASQPTRFMPRKTRPDWGGALNRVKVETSSGLRTAVAAATVAANE
jgi:hypothetical protein